MADERVEILPSWLRSVIDAVFGAFLFSIMGRLLGRRYAPHGSSLAWERLEHGRPITAGLYARMAIASDPTWPNAYRNLGLSYQRRGDSAKARAVFQRGRLVAPQDAQLLLALADLEFSLHAYSQAERWYRMAADVAPAYERLPTVLLHLAVAIFNQGRLDEAIALAQQARARAPEEREADLVLGELHFRRGEYRQAASEFRAALARDSGEADAHYWLALALAGLRHWSAALAEAREAARLAPHVEKFGKMARVIEQHSEQYPNMDLLSIRY